MYAHLPQQQPSLMVFAGATAGLSAWTKNEGLLFVVSIIVAILAFSVGSGGLKKSLRMLVPFLFGLLPILATVVYFKVSFAPPNDLISGQTVWPTIQRLTTLSRYRQVGKAFVDEVFRFGDWHPYFNIPVLLLCYLLVIGVELIEPRTGVVVSVLTVLLMAIGYFVTYIVTPRDLQWHLATSLDRLYLQLWPSFLFAFFLVARTPEKAILRS